MGVLRRFVKQRMMSEAVGSSFDDIDKYLFSSDSEEDKYK